MYEWDLDLDGRFESQTTTPSITKTYNSPISGYIQARVTNASGQSSTASAYLDVSNSASPAPAITNPSATIAGSTAEISYTFERGAIGAFASIDGAYLGLATEQNLTLTDLAENSTLTLVPLSASGTLGSPVEIHLSTADGSAINTIDTSTDAPTDTETTAHATDTANADATPPIPNLSSTQILAPNSGKH